MGNEKTKYVIFHIKKYQIGQTELQRPYFWADVEEAGNKWTHYYGNAFKFTFESAMIVLRELTDKGLMVGITPFDLEAFAQNSYNLGADEK